MINESELKSVIVLNKCICYGWSKFIGHLQIVCIANVGGEQRNNRFHYSISVRANTNWEWLICISVMPFVLATTTFTKKQKPEFSFSLNWLYHAAHCAKMHQPNITHIKPIAMGKKPANIGKFHGNRKKGTLDSIGVRSGEKKRVRSPSQKNILADSNSFRASVNGIENLERLVISYHVVNLIGFFENSKMEISAFFEPTFNLRIELFCE